MKVRILEKNYHPTNSPVINKNYRSEREEYWIRRLGTSIPYGCNDNNKSIGNLSNQYDNSINVMILFDKNPRRKRSHGNRHYTSPKMHDVPINGLLPCIQKPLELHHIRT